MGTQKKSKKMGRPKADFDLEQVGAICRLKPRQQDVAAFFKVHPDTLLKRIKKETGLTFSEFRDQHLVHTRFDLIRRAIEKAQSGDNQMLIFCLKNLTDWNDRHEIQNTNVNVNIEAAQENPAIKRLKEALTESRPVIDVTPVEVDATTEE